ncbi:1-deoxy-D-xylulose-5-phosphate reductoisomerase [Roseibium sp. RKSG952]|uniref:1-deoxy-D-xylulose-5-phosphate reductoisomerase n=1 Tax=Roseibium sp. RKSG952 TaxID=2529384 RepID=UPI0012BBC9FF|nr:1-deoxy-D-xylulose-5-phosphate reductoisomerase [Roseibium sp. RKSG952]MTH97874.1 1-deoxy-D-xylulose-5-phosphate reductoisomerase [Roseibium sp. RKSG952]
MDAATQAPAGRSRTQSETTRLIVLGATGSIGQSTLDIVRRNPDRFHVAALVANSNVSEMVRLAKDVRPDCVVCADSAKAGDLRDALQGTGIEVGAGEAAVLEAVERPADMVIAGIVGSAGLKPTVAALKPGRTLALANKECLVSAGDFFMAEAEKNGVRVLPVDSEHNAIFQIFEAENADQVEKVTLTASGGPFRTFSLSDMERVTPQQALKHPNWDMGRRITIDSATLMNKGFEVIEAFHLFPIDRSQLDVLVHPQSIVHGLVQYADGSLLAQLGAPDMRTPIARCLVWPERMEVPVERLDLGVIGSLTFETPDLQRFPALKLAYEALDEGSVATATLNAADEVAVDVFLSGGIGFLDIPRAVGHTIDEVLARHHGSVFGCAEDALEIDQLARGICRKWISASAA